MESFNRRKDLDVLASIERKLDKNELLTGDDWRALRGVQATVDPQIRDKTRDILWKLLARGKLKYDEIDKRKLADLFASEVPTESEIKEVFRKLHMIVEKD